MSIAEAYNGFFNELKSIYDDREADNIADWVFENVTQLKRWERRDNSRDITPDQKLKSDEHLHALLLHKPVQYVLNEAWFYKLKFFVNEFVLIPRPETEELVSWVVSDFQKPGERISPAEIKILDIGTGSGCIAVSLKKALPTVEITSIDVSEQALNVANENANELQTNIDFKRIDFLHEEEWQSLGNYDIIVSNPPYIPQSEKESLSKNVAAFEPGIALFVHDDDPLIFYKKIAKFSQTHLKRQGKIYVEIHEGKAKEVTRNFSECGFKTEIKNDIYGKERMIKITR